MIKEGIYELIEYLNMLLKSHRVASQKSVINKKRRLTNVKSW